MSLSDNSIPNFSELNELPKNLESTNSKIESNFVSEKIIIKELDYYFTNSISRSSKTMSECRQIRQKIKKDGNVALLSQANDMSKKIYSLLW